MKWSPPSRGNASALVATIVLEIRLPRGHSRNAGRLWHRQCRRCYTGIVSQPVSGPGVDWCLKRCSAVWLWIHCVGARPRRDGRHRYSGRCIYWRSGGNRIGSGNRPARWHKFPACCSEASRSMRSQSRVLAFSPIFPAISSSGLWPSGRLAILGQQAGPMSSWR